MDDDTRFKDLTLPEDEPWMSHGFISKIAAQVSLPYRKPKGGVKEIERRNGSLVVRYVSGADCLPYGKYPRLFELWACTMIKTDDPCFDPETNTLHLGTTFRAVEDMDWTPDFGFAVATAGVVLHVHVRTPQPPLPIPACASSPGRLPARWWPVSWRGVRPWWAVRESTRRTRG